MFFLFACATSLIFRPRTLTNTPDGRRESDQDTPDPAPRLLFLEVLPTGTFTSTEIGATPNAHPVPGADALLQTDAHPVPGADALLQLGEHPVLGADALLQTAVRPVPGADASLHLGAHPVLGADALLQTTDAHACDSIIITDLAFFGDEIDLVGTDDSGSGNYADTYCQFFVDGEERGKTSVQSRAHPAWSGPFPVDNKGHGVVIACSDSDVNEDDFIGYARLFPTVSGARTHPHIQSDFGINQKFADLGMGSGGKREAGIRSDYHVKLKYTYECKITTSRTGNPTQYRNAVNKPAPEVVKASCPTLKNKEECIRGKDSRHEFLYQACTWCCNTECPTKNLCEPIGHLLTLDWDRKGINIDGWNTCDVNPDEDTRYDPQVPGFCRFSEPEEQFIIETDDRSAGACRNSCDRAEDCGFYTFLIGSYKDTSSKVEKNTLCNLYRPATLRSDAKDFRHRVFGNQDALDAAMCYAYCPRFTRDTCAPPCFFNAYDECETDTRTWFRTAADREILVASSRNAVCRALDTVKNVNRVEDCMERCVETEDCTAINYENGNSCQLLSCNRNFPPIRKKRGKNDRPGGQGYYLGANLLFGLPPKVTCESHTEFGDTTQKLLTDGNTERRKKSSVWQSCASVGPEVKIVMSHEYNISAVKITPDCEEDTDGFDVFVGSDTRELQRCGDPVPDYACNKLGPSFTLSCAGKHRPGLLGNYVVLRAAKGNTLRLLEVEAAGSAPLVGVKHKGAECWMEGRCTTASCEFCGGGKCCRKDFGDTNCEVDEGGDNEHICVAVREDNDFGNLFANNPVGLSANADATFQCTKNGDVPLEDMLTSLKPPDSIRSRKDCLHFCLSYQFLCGGIRYVDQDCQLFKRGAKVSAMQSSVNVTESDLDDNSDKEESSIVCCVFLALVFPNNCNDDFADADGRTCDEYGDNEWCTESGMYGSQWKNGDNTFADWKNANGETALACRRCGCGTAASRGKSPTSDAEIVTIPFTALTTVAPPLEEKSPDTDTNTEVEDEKPADTSPEPKGGTNWTVILIIVGVVLIVVAIAGAWFYRKRAARDATEIYY